MDVLRWKYSRSWVMISQVFIILLYVIHVAHILLNSSNIIKKWSEANLKQTKMFIFHGKGRHVAKCEHTDLRSQSSQLF